MSQQSHAILVTQTLSRAISINATDFNSAITKATELCGNGSIKFNDNNTGLNFSSFAMGDLKFDGIAPEALSILKNAFSGDVTAEDFNIKPGFAHTDLKALFKEIGCKIEPSTFFSGFQIEPKRFPYYSDFIIEASGDLILTFVPEAELEGVARNEDMPDDMQIPKYKPLINVGYAYTVSRGGYKPVMQSLTIKGSPAIRFYREDEDTHEDINDYYHSALHLNKFSARMLTENLLNSMKNNIPEAILKEIVRMGMTS